ncbi:MAG: signal peptidase II [Acidobacteria bacterium]|nr:signal peptidase II [Acidobacteriota bacterium]
MIAPRWWPFAIAPVVAAADRLTKHVIEDQFLAWDTLTVIPGLFQIVHTRNTGIAFGMFSESGANGGARLLILFSFAVIVLVSVLLWNACKPASAEHWTLKAALSLVLGGAAGNLHDRLRFGSVTDFLDFYWGSHHFPIFNLADSAITVGAAFLILNLWLVRHSAAGAPHR